MGLERPQDAKIYVDQDMQSAESHGIAGGTAVAFSARCPTKDPPNEDVAGIIPYDANSAVLVVADGMGGGPSGEQAASLAVQALKTAVSEAARDGVILRSAIIDGIEKANLAVQALGVGAGTTLAVVEIQHRTARPYHVGDSTILIVGQRGRIKLQTISHSPVGFGVEAGLLDEAEAMHHEDRHVVSNVVGTNDMRIEIGSTVQLAERDTVLLSSDGLVDNLHVEEIVELVRKGPLVRTVDRFGVEAKSRMLEPGEGRPSKPDDTTIVAFRPLPPRG